MPAEDTKVALEILLQSLSENPQLWETRKKAAKLLYQDEKYTEAADIIWNAPEIPSTDVDIAFVLKMISRVKPNRSIRLIYEVVRRNHNKPHKNMAVAKALNEIGMYMEAARFYGAALAVDSSLFDLGFEREALWLDDSGRLLDEWRKTDQASKPPLNVPQQDISGGAIATNSLDSNIEGQALADTSPPPIQIPAPVMPAAPIVPVAPAGVMSPAPVRQASPTPQISQVPPPPVVNPMPAQPLVNTPAPPQVPAPAVLPIPPQTHVPAPQSSLAASPPLGYAPLTPQQIQPQPQLPPEPATAQPQPPAIPVLIPEPPRFKTK